MSPIRKLLNDFANELLDVWSTLPDYAHATIEEREAHDKTEFHLKELYEKEFLKLGTAAGQPGTD